MPNNADFVDRATRETFIVRGEMHQAMLCDKGALDDYLAFNGYRRTLFAHQGGTPYSVAEVRRDDGSTVAELFRITHD